MNHPYLTVRPWNSFSLPTAANTAVAMCPKDYSFTGATSVTGGEYTTALLSVGSGHDFAVGQMVYIVSTTTSLAGWKEVVSVQTTTIVVQCGVYSGTSSGTLTRPIAGVNAMVCADPGNLSPAWLYFKGVKLAPLNPGDVFNLPFAHKPRWFTDWSIKPDSGAACVFNVVYEG